MMDSVFKLTYLHSNLVYTKGLKGLSKYKTLPTIKRGLIDFISFKFCSVGFSF